MGGLTAISLLTFHGCTTTETGRRQLNLVSQEQEMQLGLTAFEQMKKETPISKNAKYNDMVQRVGRRIAEQAKERMPNAQWEFVVFDSPEANAFCLPGGKIGVYSGLMPIAQNEAGLAVVVGHEVAHASQRHGAERMSEALALQGVGQALGAFTPQQYSQAAMIAFGLGAKVGRELPHGRSQESEADHVGLLYMARAGYDPEEAVRFWQRFSEAKGSAGGGTPEFLRTHPLDSTRIANLQKWMPEAKAQFRGAKTSGAAPEAPAGKGAPTTSSGRTSGRSSGAGSTVIGR
jgi:metalloendopeptidase OMA1, mitochondrial